MLKQENSDWFSYKGRSFAKEPQKTDPLSLHSAEQDAHLYSRAYHLQNSHEKGYETVITSTNNILNDSFHRRQHFVKGTVPGGSTQNKMVYGTEELQLLRKYQEDDQYKSEKPLGFMYGTEAATKVGKQLPSRKPNNALLLETRTVDDSIRNKKLAFDQDDFMAKHLDERRKQKHREQEEKRRDLEMLRNLDPWGKPGHGAPMKAAPTETPAAKRTKAVNDLVEEQYHPYGGGSGAGGGAVNRTTSGKPLTFFHGDPELRFQNYGKQQDVEPSLRYKKNAGYGKELDSLLEEAKTRKELQRQDSFEKELRHISQDPFGRPGGGAPIKNRRGDVQAAFPTTLSRDIHELRQVEPRHSHAYSITPAKQQSRYDEPQYDPWGRGCGKPDRDETGRLLRKNQKIHQDDLEGLGIPIGRPGAGAPVRDSDGRVQVRKAQTLTKTATGQTLPRDFSPKGREYYHPFGKPGGGAPMRDGDGYVNTNVMGKVEKETMDSSQSRNDTLAKQEYLRTLRDMTDQAHQQRKAEYQDLKTGGADVAAWMRSGVVGQPKYNPLTKEIVAAHKQTSDITQQKLNIRRQKNDSSRDYHHDLELLAEERQQQRRREKELDMQYTKKHVDTMNNIWGRPGCGAPLTNGDVSFARKQKVGIAPADQAGFREA